jgi:ribosomal protein S18 acetylase RimI-like enzyme
VAAGQGNRGVDAHAAPGEKKGAVVVERLTHEDVPAICALYKRVGDAQATGLPPELAKGWQHTPLDFTSRMEGITYFAARRDGRMVGAIGCENRHGACHLLDLAVEPEARRQGVATLLLATAVEWAKKSNLPTIWVDALARYATAAALLKKLGFAEAGVLHRHEWGEDIRLFERVL